MGADIPLELHKLFFTLGFLVIAAVSNWISLSYIHDVAGREPLPDALFSLLPETSWALEVGDLMVTLCALSAIVVCFLHRYRFVVLRRLLFIAAVLYTLRSLTLLATQLPSGYSDNETRCRERLNGTDRTLKVYFLRTIEQTIHIGFQDIEAKMLCGDLLFSGHTLVMIVSWLMVDYYLPKPYRWFRFVPMVFAVIGMVCMVVSRTHYSVDVLVAYLLSLLVFSIYHAFTEVDTYRERKNSALSRIWIMWIVFWLEDNVVPGRLENEFSFPCCGESDDRLPTTTESMSSSSSVPVIQAA